MTSSRSPEVFDISTSTRDISTPVFTFDVHSVSELARCGLLSCPRGSIRTPAFMPVGTQGAVKALYMDQVRSCSDIILGNTYHLMLRPGAERIAALGGLHEFIGWRFPILTDSGGFQIMSLSSLREVTESGVTFRSHIDGSTHELTPERSIQIQGLLGSDIQMQLDECVRLPSPVTELRRSMELSLRWAERSLSAFDSVGDSRVLFGIVQGGDNESLRLESASHLESLNLFGYAIGGLAVGESQDIMLRVVDIVCSALPEQKPRYLMGVGTPDDLLESIRLGVDMFDCVMPTRAGRHGTAFTRFGKLNLRNSCHADDSRPLDESVPCPASRDYSRAYLHHLFRCNESLGGMLLSWHNLSYYQQLMTDSREAISSDTYESFVLDIKEGWERGDEHPRD